MKYAQVASGRFFFLDSMDNGAGDHDRRHFLKLDPCFLCKRRIASNHHAYMYTGDAAFCSEDRRQEQMDMDAALAAAAHRHRAPLIIRPSSLRSD
uniref:Uncharacterized protein n=1 Tax=Aegilops tauschii TaxID=37682 RepID=M8C4X1_AEGTA